MPYRILMCGAGAIGGYFGAAMIRSGLDVTLVDPWPENVEKIRSVGLRIEGKGDGSDTATVATWPLHVGDVQNLVRTDPFDVVFIAQKSYDTAWSTQLALPWLSESGAIVSLQNSVNEPVIAALAGPERTYGCAIASLACELVAPGVVRRLAPKGSVAVGALEGAGPWCQPLIEILSSAEQTTATENLNGVKWSKLIVNSMRNGLSAMTGMTGRERDSDPVTVELGITLGAQAVKVGRALGYRLVDTTFDFAMLEAAADGDPAARASIRSAMTEVAAGRSADQRPSMAQDIRKGRRTETDAINGLVARRGRELGIDVGAHERVNAIIKRIERGELSPDPSLAENIA